MNTCLIGDCRDSMRKLIAQGVKVQTCVTSPPYFGLRNYGVDGQLGLEATPQEYVANMVEVFRLVRELLADDGVIWVNLGDSYAANRGYQVPSTLMNGDATNQAQAAGGRGMKAADYGLKPKNLIGIPWRVAFALQDDGWILRQDIIWHKPNPMPESVTDRCTKSHEYIFLLAKSGKPTVWKAKDTGEWARKPNLSETIPCGTETEPRWRGHDYYFDHEAIKEPAKFAGEERSFSTTKKSGRVLDGSIGSGNERLGAPPIMISDNRNRRSVWEVATQPYSGAHFATFPPALIEPCILAGSRPGDIVFDPFLGSGTTAQVAQDLGRRWIGCELNESYVGLQRERVKQQGLVFA